MEIQAYEIKVNEQLQYEIGGIPLNIVFNGKAKMFLNCSDTRLNV